MGRRIARVATSRYRLSSKWADLARVWYYASLLWALYLCSCPRYPSSCTQMHGGNRAREPRTALIRLALYIERQLILCSSIRIGVYVYIGFGLPNRENSLERSSLRNKRYFNDPRGLFRISRSETVRTALMVSKIRDIDSDLKRNIFFFTYSNEIKRTEFILKRRI